MKKFITLYEESNLAGYIDEHRIKALEVLYLIAKICETENHQAMIGILKNSKEIIHVKLALYAARGLRVENMLPWQESLKELCQSAIGRLTEKGFFTKEEGFDYLIEPLIKSKFSPEHMETIFDEITIIAKEKIDKAIRQLTESD